MKFLIRQHIAVPSRIYFTVGETVKYINKPQDYLKTIKHWENVSLVIHKNILWREKKIFDLNFENQLEKLSVWMKGRNKSHPRGMKRCEDTELGW